MSTFTKFWGVRGSIPTPGHHTHRYGGNTSCVEVRVGENLFILDAGTGIRDLGIDLMNRGLNNIEGHLLVSHPHWDHIQGFPFFTPSFVEGNTFKVYSTGEADGHEILGLLSGQMDSKHFPVAFRDLGAKIIPGELSPVGTDINGTTVKFMKQVHPGGSYGYSIEGEGKKVVYATDSEVDAHFKAEGSKVDIENEPEELRVVPDRYLEFADGADLLIADTQYTDEEYAGKVGWGHPRASTIVDMAIQAGVKRLALFHHDPMHSDEHVEEKLLQCQERARYHGSSIEIFAGRERLELKV